MANENVTTVRFGGLGTLLTVAFVVLRLVGVISWKWVWVLSPLWISWGLAILLFIFIIVLKALVDRY